MDEDDSNWEQHGSPELTKETFHVAGKDLHIYKAPKFDSGFSGTFLTGQSLWPSAKVLALYLTLIAKTVKSASGVLELGSGPGLVGLTAAQLAADTRGKVILTDHEERVLQITRMNIAANFPSQSDSPRCAHLTWGENVEEFRKQHGQFDLILGSDIVYNEDAIPRLFRTVQALLALNDCSTFLLAYDTRGGWLDGQVDRHSEQVGLEREDIVIAEIPACKQLLASIEWDYPLEDKLRLLKFTKKAER
ncbi:protein N-lysine methyltransferase METTL21A-like isoform X2 [Branchiostoma lanceolatum]|uniref:protein N-lysine methyltransferase METTL21A-like isoform X2 n=1 Tax=Branchiostoma lanceolatum TaxID=7740 RepID=UPI00345122E3